MDTLKKAGYIILQVAVYLIFIGGVSDIVMTFIENPLPSSHLNFLRIKPEVVSSELGKLDHALLRAMGSCWIAISTGSLILLFMD